MKKEKYLNLTSDELFSILITDVINNPQDSDILLEHLSKEDRYQDDYEFRITVETAKGILISMKGEPTSLISHASKLIKTATALHLHKAAAGNWNLLGIGYSQSGFHEKAIECYHKVIRIEKEQGLNSISSVAYNNIAMIYIVFGLHEKSVEYFSLAVETLKSGGKKQPRYKSKLVLYMSNLITSYCRSKNLEPVPDLIQKIRELGMDDLHNDSVSAYYFGLMYYYFMIQEFDKGKEAYHLAKKHTNPDNTAALYALAGNFMDLCHDCSLCLDFYKDELLTAEELQTSNPSLTNVSVYKRLRRYYKESGDKKKYFEILEKYVDFLEEDAEITRERQGESLLLVDSMIIKNDSFDTITEKNTELELLAEEATKHKNALQKAYYQIGLINELGKQITSSLKIREVLDSIFKIISDYIPLSTFFLLVAEDEHILRSMYWYEEGEVQPEFTIDLRTSTGFIAECYKKNKIISTNDEEYLSFFEEQRKIQTQTDNASAIFLPLAVTGKVIGIFSVQEEKEDAYTEENKAFLEGILPYLSIALNNAIYSRNLEKEIASHLNTQKELKDANSKLQKISSLDGLTQISSRRDFDARINQMIQNAKRKEQTISILMLDIDNFKLYNDSYGHLEGDEALKKVAKVFRQIMDKYDGLSARFGGEEFIGACVGKSSDESFAIAEEIRTSVFELNIPHERSPFQRISISIGISVAQNLNINQKSAIMKQADSCLYLAKESGRNKTIMKPFFLSES